jgi:hypothetical protein
MNRFLWLLLLSVLVTVFLSKSSFAQEEDEPKKPSKYTKDGKLNWNTVVDDLDKEWEEGDDPTELEHEFEYNRKLLAQKQPKFNSEDGASIRKAYESDPFAFSGGGGMMIFVDLKPKDSPYTKDEMDKLAKRYATLLRSGSIMATVYNLQEKRLLVQIEKSWYTKDTLNFIAHQPEVLSFDANSKTYFPKDFMTEDEDEDDL